MDPGYIPPSALFSCYRAENCVIFCAEVVWMITSCHMNQDFVSQSIYNMLCTYGHVLCFKTYTEQLFPLLINLSIVFSWIDWLFHKHLEKCQIWHLQMFVLSLTHKLSLLSKVCKENKKMFTSKELESENFDFFFLKTQFKLIILSWRKLVINLIVD